MKTRQLISSFALLSLFSFTACDDDPMPEPGRPDVDINQDPEGDVGAAGDADAQEIVARPPAAMMSEPVEEDPELWANGSCAGACGGPAPDRSCWCDYRCARHGDCCDDYREECLGDPGSKKKKKKKKKKSEGNANFRITGYSVSGSGCDGYTPDGEPKEKTMITNSFPGGPKDYFQTTFDGFEARRPEGNSSRRCRLTIRAKWTPGHRVILDNVQLSGHGDLSDTRRARARINTRIRGGYTSFDDTQSFRSPEQDSFDPQWGSSSLDVYSGCSGSGSFSFDMDVSLRGVDDGEGSASVDQLSGIIRLAKSYEVPGC